MFAANKSLGSNLNHNEIAYLMAFLPPPEFLEEQTYFQFEFPNEEKKLEQYNLIKDELGIEKFVKVKRPQNEKNNVLIHAQFKSNGSKLYKQFWQKYSSPESTRNSDITLSNEDLLEKFKLSLHLPANIIEEMWKDNYRLHTLIKQLNTEPSLELFKKIINLSEIEFIEKYIKNIVNLSLIDEILGSMNIKNYHTINIQKLPIINSMLRSRAKELAPTERLVATPSVNSNTQQISKIEQDEHENFTNLCSWYYTNPINRNQFILEAWNKNILFTRWIKGYQVDFVRQLRNYKISDNELIDNFELFLSFPANLRDEMWQDNERLHALLKTLEFSRFAKLFENITTHTDIDFIKKFIENISNTSLIINIIQLRTKADNSHNKIIFSDSVWNLLIMRLTKLSPQPASFSTPKPDPIPPNDIKKPLILSNSELETHIESQLIQNQTLKNSISSKNISVKKKNANNNNLKLTKKNTLKKLTFLKVYQATQELFEEKSDFSWVALALKLNVDRLTLGTTLAKNSILEADLKLSLEDYTRKLVSLKHQLDDTIETQTVSLSEIIPFITYEKLYDAFKNSYCELNASHQLNIGRYPLRQISNMYVNYFELKLIANYYSLEEFASLFGDVKRPIEKNTDLSKLVIQLIHEIEVGKRAIQLKSNKKKAELMTINNGIQNYLHTISKNFIYKTENIECMLTHEIIKNPSFDINKVDMASSNQNMNNFVQVSIPNASQSNFYFFSNKRKITDEKEQEISNPSVDFNLNKKRKLNDSVNDAIQTTSLSNTTSTTENQIKTEKAYEDEPVSDHQPILKLDLQELHQVVKNLRGESNDQEFTCPNLSQNIIDYFNTGKIPTEAVGEKTHPDDTALMLTTFSQDCRRDLKSEPVGEHEELTVAEEKKLVNSYTNIRIERDSFFGSYAPCGMIPMYEETDKEFVHTSYVYDIDYGHPEKANYVDLDNKLKAEAAANPSKVSFGIINMGRCGKYLDNLLHTVVYYATPTHVSLIDAQGWDGKKQTGKYIFDCIGDMFEFAVKAKKISAKTFGTRIFYTPLGPGLPEKIVTVMPGFKK